MDYERLAAELLRVIRGRRSQAAFSKRLGYRSNIAYRWESARCFPTAAQALQAAERCRIPVDQAVRRFLGQRALPAGTSVTTAHGVRVLLAHLRGSTPITELAARSGYSRFSLSRWLKGQAQPKLPELLGFIQASTLRLLDFLGELVDVGALPSVADAWRALRAARDAAYDLPWSHAVLRTLEVADYAALAKHQPGWIAERLGINRKEEQRCLQVLREARQIRFDGKRWVVEQARTVDTRADPEKSRKVKALWMEVAAERFAAGTPGTFGYNLMAISAADLERLRQIHAEYFRQMQALVADSKAPEHVVLFNTQLFALDAATGNARSRPG